MGDEGKWREERGVGREKTVDRGIKISKTK